MDFLTRRELPYGKVMRERFQFFFPAVKSIKNRMDIKWFYNLLHLLAFFLSGDEPALNGETGASWSENFPAV